VEPPIPAGRPPRVVTSCHGRFHIFDQARELARHGALHQLITDYPKAWPARYGVPPEKVRALLLAGIVNHGLFRARGFLPRPVRPLVHRWIHDRFSLGLAALIPDGTEFFIGLSSFCLEALDACREKGIPCAVDHGSLHQRENRRLVREEAARWGLSAQGEPVADWIIEKEDREFRAADHVFVLSGSARDSMVRCGIDPEKIFVNPCGVDLSAFRPGKKRDGIFRVIQVGAINLGKGVLTLLDAFAQASLPKAELWFVGAGLEASGLQGTIDRLRPAGVTFLPPVAQSRLGEFYSQSSIFVLASVADGFAMVVPQAMACGLPVIVTENVGARDLVEDGVNGFVVPVGAPEIIADRLRRLQGDPDLLAAMGRAARKTVETGYGWRDYGDRLVEALRRRKIR
jgi:glycosyltransferase involved in cell wall biosynthesis